MKSRYRISDGRRLADAGQPGSGVRLGTAVHRWARLALAVISMLAATQPALPQTSETLNRYIEDSLRITEKTVPTPGSLFSANGYMVEPARDPRAALVGDLVTILVAEQASALSSGTTTQSRTSESDSSISKFLGVLGVRSALANLAAHDTTTSLDGQGSTSRQTSVTTTLTAQVSHVMPNGNLVIEGAKEIAVNSERQLVWMRGVVRPADLNPDNSVSSNRIAMMDLRVNGKGVVNSAIKQPNIVYRILKELLPF